MGQETGQGTGLETGQKTGQDTGLEMGLDTGQGTGQEMDLGQGLHWTGSIVFSVEQSTLNKQCGPSTEPCGTSALIVKVLLCEMVGGATCFVDD